MTGLNRSYSGSALGSRVVVYHSSHYAERKYRSNAAEKVLTSLSTSYATRLAHQNALIVRGFGLMIGIELPKVCGDSGCDRS